MYFYTPPHKKWRGIIRILHGCEVWIENSVSRVTVGHHEALPSDPEGRNFLSQQTPMFDSFSCIHFAFESFILKIAFITTYNGTDVGHFYNYVTVTSE